MIKISDSVIKEMYKHIFLKYEVCANIKINNNRIIFELINFQKGDYIINDKQGSCKYKNYSKIIYHSHPIITYSYPSVPDILKIVKRQEHALEYVNLNLQKDKEIILSTIKKYHNI